VGHPRTWQWPFDSGRVWQAARLLVWIQSEVFGLPHPLLLSRVWAGNLVDGGQAPLVDLLGDPQVVL